jgi:cell division protease FtsH
MVTKYGMSDTLGTITFGSGQEEVFLGRDWTQTRNYSEETSSKIDEEVKKIIDKGYNRAKEILTMHSDKLHAVANKLLEQEKIEGEEFDAIFEE